MKGARIVVGISGGNLTGIFTDSSSIEVYLVDYDNLETEPGADCGIPFPVDSIDTFHSVVESEVESYPGIAKLIARLGH